MLHSDRSIGHATATSHDRQDRGHENLSSEDCSEQGERNDDRVGIASEHGR